MYGDKAKLKDSFATGKPISSDLALRRWWPLGLVFALGLGLRLLHLGSQSLFMDEGKSWAVTLLTPAEILALSDIDHHAPLYFLLLKLVMAVLPASEAGLRALSFVASATALIAILGFAYAEWGTSAAAYAGVLTALSTFDLYYSQEARMYTLLAAAWVVSYVALIKALQGKPGWLVVWALACMAMPWTHMYGFLVLGAYAVFIAGYLALKRLRGLTTPLDDRPLVAACVVVLIGILPMVRLLLLHSDTGSQGASVPQLTDLGDLYLLATAGLVAARHHFVDSSHLTLPATGAIKPAVWFLAGTIISGAPAAVGLVNAWRMRGTRQLQAVLAMLLIFLPVAVAFGYSVVMRSQVWIQRPFLGAALLVYLWAGIGLATLPWRRARWMLAVLASTVALASLLPYFTIWQKSDAARALTTMPGVDEHNALVLQMRFLASQARFYVGADTPVLMIEVDKQGAPAVARPVFDGEHAYIKVMGRPHAVTCDELASVTDLWLYGNARLIRKALPQLPGCVTEKHLWLFDKGRWTELPFYRTETIPGSGWLQFDEVRNASWTTENYRHLNPGDIIKVELSNASEGARKLVVRYYDFRQKILEVRADGQVLGRFGDGSSGSGWQEATLDLPSTSGDSMLIEIKNVGPNGVGVSRVGVTSAEH